MIVNIVSGSPLVNLELMKQVKCDYVIGVDFGAFNLISHEVTCDVAIGDFDSINHEQLEFIKSHCKQVLVYPSQKDETDTEIAVNYALSLNPDLINVFGVTGKRLDHFLGAFYLFKKALEKDVRLNIIDEHNRLSVLKPGVYTIQKSQFKYISFFSFNDCVKSLTLTGFKYKLSNHELKNENSLCLSNEIVSQSGTISFNDGNLLIVESND